MCFHYSNAFLIPITIAIEVIWISVMPSSRDDFFTVCPGHSWLDFRTWRFDGRLPQSLTLCQCWREIAWWSRCDLFCTAIPCWCLCWCSCFQDGWSKPGHLSHRLSSPCFRRDGRGWSQRSQSSQTCLGSLRSKTPLQTKCSLLSWPQFPWLHFGFLAPLLPQISYPAPAIEY